MRALVDADMIIFKAGMAGEERYYNIIGESGDVLDTRQYMSEVHQWVAEHEHAENYTWEMQRIPAPLNHVLANAKTVMKAATAFATEWEVFIAGEGNYRFDIYPCYKANRKGGMRPFHEEAIREYLIKYWNATTVDGEEADDKVSYLQCAAEVGSTYIASCDKDLLNTPGFIFNWDKMDEPLWVSQEQADLNFYRQLLTGDATDNIPGLKRMGPKTAAKVLPEWSVDMKQIVAQEYEKHYGSDWLEVINMNGSLLWMRRSPNEIWQWEDEEIV